MNFFKRMTYVVLLAFVIALPVDLITSPKINAPLWYIVLDAIASTLGLSILSIAVGVIVLAFMRNSKSGGLTEALFSVFAVSIFCLRGLLGFHGLGG